MTESVLLKRDMAVTHVEFYRLIKKTIDNANNLSVDTANSLTRFPYANGEVIINLEKQQVRKIASLSIHHTIINFKFQNLTKNEIDSYLRKFDITFQKGGG